jgi:hypothetical protein
MRIVSKFAALPKDLSKDSIVYIDADRVYIIRSFRLPEFESVSEGVWKVASITKNIVYGIHKGATEVFDVSLELQKQDSDKWAGVDHVEMRLIGFSGDVFIENATLVAKPLKFFADTVKELEELNKNRTHCIVCHEALNIISPNMIVCNHCEKYINI